MTWVRIDDGFADHPKILKAGPLAIVAQVRALCYCSRHLTDGFLPDDIVMTILSDLSPIKAISMCQAKLWQRVGGRRSGYKVHDYLKYNPSRAETLQLRTTKRLAGQAGGIAKAIADATARAIAAGNPSAMPPSPTPRTTTSKKTRTVAHATGSNGTEAGDDLSAHEANKAKARALLESITKRP